MVPDTSRRVTFRTFEAGAGSHSEVFRQLTRRLVCSQTVNSLNPFAAEAVGLMQICQ